jgi:hypothetical protein
MVERGWSRRRCGQDLPHVRTCPLEREPTRPPMRGTQVSSQSPSTAERRRRRGTRWTGCGAIGVAVVTLDLFVRFSHKPPGLYEHRDRPGQGAGRAIAGEAGLVDPAAARPSSSPPRARGRWCGSSEGTGTARTETGKSPSNHGTFRVAGGSCGRRRRESIPAAAQARSRQVGTRPRLQTGQTRGNHARALCPPDRL